jgi:hypothetical protein
MAKSVSELRCTSAFSVKTLLLLVRTVSIEPLLYLALCLERVFLVPILSQMNPHPHNRFLQVRF